MTKITVIVINECIHLLMVINNLVNVKISKLAESICLSAFMCGAFYLPWHRSQIGETK